MRIYLANLAKYNEGRLVGQWIDLPQDPSDLQRAIDTVLGCCDEEYAIHDYEAPFAVSEWDNPFTLNQIAELSDEGVQQYAYLIGEGYDHAYAMEHYEDVIFYADMNMGQLVEEMLEEGLWGEIPEPLRWHLDYDKLERTLEMDGYCQTDRGVFCYQ